MQVSQPQGSTVKATTNRYDSRTAEKFVLRMPDGMRSRIEALASERHRSMNSEITIRLERSFINTDLVERQSLLIQQLSTRIDDLEQINTNLREHVKDLIADCDVFSEQLGNGHEQR
ncbi:Arc family DNA-binding protein [Pseudomonas psychrophila]|uniref:Arc family DNA-binding protein n=1 Tax=Pseudomonas psychrophila TaxID=122355 RepID=UPI00031A27DB|nr:Arc family DNA-binding protein [Pseudomonas psychrophila]